MYEALTARHRHYWANFLQTQAIREKASAHMTGASAISVQCKKALLLSPGVYLVDVCTVQGTFL